MGSAAQKIPPGKKQGKSVSGPNLEVLEGIFSKPLSKKNLKKDETNIYIECILYYRGYNNGKEKRKR